MLGAPTASAGLLTEGSVLPGYAVVSVGPNSSIMVNSGPINGAVLLGDGGNSTSSGGAQGPIAGGVYVSGSQTTPHESGDLLQNDTFTGTYNSQSYNGPPSLHYLNDNDAAAIQAFNDAASLSSAAAALPVNGSFTGAGTNTNPYVINGNGGQEVIDFTTELDNNPYITINGNSSDTFVFNVSGDFMSNVPMTLNGVTASQILWNLTAGTSGKNIFQTSGGDVLYGTFLATLGGDFQFSNLDLTGQLINTDGHMQIVSGSGVSSFAPFVPLGGGSQNEVPEPASLTLLATGLVALGMTQRRQRKR
jgi:hypothetical protein